MANAIEINNFSKYYGKKPGVIDLSLSVESGDIFGFLGPNGAGKSTTIRSMLGLIKYSEGDINILGMSPKKSNKDILKQIGYMPSEAMFYPNMKAKDVIKMAADIRGIDCSAYAKELCDRLDVNLNKRIDELSLGNRKKVGIVCAIQHSPSLYIFDEPTSGLDPLIQAEFFKIVLEQNKKGATVFLSSHVLSEVKKYCKHIGIIKDGKLITIDTVDNITQSHTKHIKIIIDEIEKDYIFNGNINEFIESLQGHNIEELIIEEPSLEDTFMHFYKD